MFETTVHANKNSQPTRPVTFQASRLSKEKVFLRLSSPCSASKCHAGIGVTVMSGCASRIESRKRSVTKSSDGAMRATSLSNCASVTSVAKKSPLLSVNHTKPHFASRPAGRETASKTASFFSGNNEVSVRVPGVMMREIRRCMRPLPGVPICSAMTTDSPKRTSRATYWSNLDFAGISYETPITDSSVAS